jgi:hypothetical protein
MGFNMLIFFTDLDATKKHFKLYKDQEILIAQK